MRALRRPKKRVGERAFFRRLVNKIRCPTVLGKKASTPARRKNLIFRKFSFYNGSVEVSQNPNDFQVEAVAANFVAGKNNGVHDEVRNAHFGEKKRGRRPGRACADDENVGFYDFCGHSEAKVELSLKIRFLHHI